MFCGQVQVCSFGVGNHCPKGWTLVISNPSLVHGTLVLCRKIKQCSFLKQPARLKTLNYKRHKVFALLRLRSLKAWYVPVTTVGHLCFKYAVCSLFVCKIIILRLYECNCVIWYWYLTLKPCANHKLFDVSVAGYHSVPDANQTITSSRLYHEFAVPQHPGRKQTWLSCPSCATRCSDVLSLPP